MRNCASGVWNNEQEYGKHEKGRRDFQAEQLLKKNRGEKICMGVNLSWSIWNKVSGSLAWLCLFCLSMCSLRWEPTETNGILEARSPGPRGGTETEWDQQGDHSFSFCHQHYDPVLSYWSFSAVIDPKKKDLNKMLLCILLWASMIHTMATCPPSPTPRSPWEWAGSAEVSEKLPGLCWTWREQRSRVLTELAVGPEMALGKNHKESYRKNGKKHF